jgi:hypothetical protein
VLPLHFLLSLVVVHAVKPKKESTNKMLDFDENLSHLLKAQHTGQFQ